MGRLSRQAQRIERDLDITAKALKLFIRFWLTVAPPLPGDDQAPAQVRGWERYEGFVETLGRRLQKGQSFLKEIPEAVFPPGEGSRGSRHRRDVTLCGRNAAAGYRDLPPFGFSGKELSEHRNINRHICGMMR